VTDIASEQDVVAVLAHQLRAALAPIMVVLEWMRRDLDSELLHRGRAIVERQVPYQTSLLDGLMDLARMTHESFELDRTPVDVVAIAARH
jgi:signal transduction histidine kinase